MFWHPSPSFRLPPLHRSVSLPAQNRSACALHTRAPSVLLNSLPAPLPVLARSLALLSHLAWHFCARRTNSARDLSISIANTELETLSQGSDRALAFRNQFLFSLLEPPISKQI
eukprot:3113388-Rhodomonas_salina.1